MIYSFEAGEVKGRKEMEVLPIEFKNVLMISDNSWERPYWQTVKPEWIAVSQPAYDKIDTSLNMKTVESNTTTQSHHLAQVTEIPEEETFLEPVGDILPELKIQYGEKAIHLNQALKMALSAKDFVYKDRSKRHRAEKYLQGLHPLPEEHPILPGQLVAIREKRGCQWCNIVRIASLRSATTGQLIYSAAKKDTKFRGILTY